ncbi:hypothetical protein H0H92_009743, partial [Tricholoma furcatifolium]
LKHGSETHCTQTLKHLNGLLDFAASERAGLEGLWKALKSGKKATLDGAARRILSVEERDDCGSGAECLDYRE